MTGPGENGSGRAGSRSPRGGRLAIGALVLAGVVVFAVLVARRAAPPPDAPTFNRDIAPIVFGNCVQCHRPQGSGPFPFLTYRQVKKRASDMLEVLESGFMPPWLPDLGYVDFSGQRGLSADKIETFAAWVKLGMPEGADQPLPPIPQFPDGWTLGRPDLVLRLQEPYPLVAEGRDVFRNLVIPVPVEETRYVRALEFRPGNAQVVHHTIMRVDPTSRSRRQDEEDAEPGFPGMDMGSSVDPDGHFLGWTPGKEPYLGSEESAWRLEPGMSMVVQLHMKPSGKPELIDPQIGLYFSERPPTKRVYPIQLTAENIDIPAGIKKYEIRDEFVLPVDVLVFGIYPHAHYVGKTMDVWAVLPDGTKQWLIRISDWAFDWQDEYHYSQPIPLPKGTTLHMYFTYDNSAENERNPFDPPQRIVLGNESTDEMGSALLQVLLRDSEEQPILHLAQMRHYANYSPRWPWAHLNLAQALEQVGELDEAMDRYRRALELHPGLPDAHYRMGFIHGKRDEFDAAIDAYRLAIEADPKLAEAHNNLANLYFKRGRLQEAVEEYRRTLELIPEEGVVHYNLARALMERGDDENAERHARTAAGLMPDSAAVQGLLRTLERKRE